VKFLPGYLTESEKLPNVIVGGVNDGDGRGRDGGGAFCGVDHNVYIT